VNATSPVGGDPSPVAGAAVTGHALVAGVAGLGVVAAFAGVAAALVVGAATALAAR